MNGRERNPLRVALIVVAVTAASCVPPSSAVAQWAILSGRSDLAASHIPEEADQKLKALGQQGAELKAVAFAPKGGWVILANRNSSFARNAPPEAVEKLAELAKEGADLRSIAFAPNGGWVIVANRNTYHAHNIPDDARTALDGFAKQGAELRSVAFAPNGGWVIIASGNAYFARNIPDEAFNKLGELAKQGAELKAIAFAPSGGWVVIANRNTHFARNIPDDAFQKLGALAQQGLELKAPSFLPRTLIQLSLDDSAMRAVVLERMAAHKVPGLSIAVIKDGRVKWARGYGVLRAGAKGQVTAHTRFQAASVSKPVTALAALRLVQQGKLVLDQPLNKSLTSWKVPENGLTRMEEPTLRQLLSHSAGFSVHGFGGYPVGAALPSLREILDGKPPANSPPIRVVLRPGSKGQYSGGGYTVLQRLIMDVTGKPFPQAMQTLVLGPVDMTESTFAQPLPKRLAPEAASAHIDGKPIPGAWHVYPEMAAAGLWTTPTDLARYVMALQRAQQGGAEPILNPELAGAMLHPQKDQAGLGVFLSGRGRSAWFSHNGVNAGFECLFTGAVETGDGAVLMTNADGGSALINELVQDLRLEYNWPGS